MPFLFPHLTHVRPGQIRFRNSFWKPRCVTSAPNRLPQTSPCSPGPRSLLDRLGCHHDRHANVCRVQQSTSTCMHGMYAGIRCGRHAAVSTLLPRAASLPGLMTGLHYWVRVHTGAVLCTRSCSQQHTSQRPVHTGTDALFTVLSPKHPRPHRTLAQSSAACPPCSCAAGVAARPAPRLPALQDYMMSPPSGSDHACLALRLRLRLHAVPMELLACCHRAGRARTHLQPPPDSPLAGVGRAAAAAAYLIPC